MGFFYVSYFAVASAYFLNYLLQFNKKSYIIDVAFFIDFYKNPNGMFIVLF